MISTFPEALGLNHDDLFAYKIYQQWRKLPFDVVAMHVISALSTDIRMRSGYCAE